MRLFLAATLAFGLSTAAHAAVVGQGSTLAGDAGGIDAQGADVSIVSDNDAYSDEITVQPSEWVWVGSINAPSATFEFSFDLTGFDVSTASLDGVWGVDNFGSILLNGTLIAELTGNVVDHFSILRGYGTDDAGLFNQGLNTVTYAMFNGGPGPAAFRATAVVEADPISAVPLPAGGLLLLGALAGLGLRRRVG